MTLFSCPPAPGPETPATEKPTTETPATSDPTGAALPPDDAPIKKKFWGWWSQADNEKYYISGNDLKVYAYNYITLNNTYALSTSKPSDETGFAVRTTGGTVYSLSEQEQDILRWDAGNNQVYYIHRERGPDARMTSSLYSVGARALNLGAAGGIALIVQNLKNEEDKRQATTDQTGGFSVAELVPGDTYIAYPATGTQADSVPLSTVVPDFVDPDGLILTGGDPKGALKLVGPTQDNVTTLNGTGNLVRYPNTSYTLSFNLHNTTGKPSGALTVNVPANNELGALFTYNNSTSFPVTSVAVNGYVNMTLRVTLARAMSAYVENVPLKFTITDVASGDSWHQTVPIRFFREKTIFQAVRGQINVTNQDVASFTFTLPTWPSGSASPVLRNTRLMFYVNSSTTSFEIPVVPGSWQVSVTNSFGVGQPMGWTFCVDNGQVHVQADLQKITASGWVDPSEPDDTKASAKSVLGAGPVLGILSSRTDLDICRFEMPSTSFPTMPETTLGHEEYTVNDARLVKDSGGNIAIAALASLKSDPSKMVALSFKKDANGVWQETRSPSFDRTADPSSSAFTGLRAMYDTSGQLWFISHQWKYVTSIYAEYAPWAYRQNADGSWSGPYNGSFIASFTPYPSTSPYNDKKMMLLTDGPAFAFSNNNGSAAYTAKFDATTGQWTLENSQPNTLVLDQGSDAADAWMLYRSSSTVYRTTRGLSESAWGSGTPIAHNPWPTVSVSILQAPIVLSAQKHAEGTFFLSYFSGGSGTYHGALNSGGTPGILGWIPVSNVSGGIKAELFSNGTMVSASCDTLTGDTRKRIRVTAIKGKDVAHIASSPISAYTPLPQQVTEGKDGTAHVLFTENFDWKIGTWKPPF